MDVRLPKLGEGADSGTVVGLFVKEGDLLKKGQTVLELENEKAVAAIPSPAEGKVTRVNVKIGDKISVGQVILAVDGPGGAPAAKEEKPAPKAQPAPARPATPAPTPEATAPARQAAAPRTDTAADKAGFAGGGLANATRDCTRSWPGSE